MNRIREIREAQGLTQQALGDMIKTTSQTVGRLEKGTRRLTEDWMRSLAAALNVEPADLLESAQLASLKHEIKAAEHKIAGSVARALSARKVRFYKVMVPSLADSGLTVGRTFVADHTDDAVASAKTGDLVVVEMWPRLHAEGPRYTMIRMFVGPAMLVTNRPGTNLAVKLDDYAVASRITGIIDPESIADS